MEHLEKKKNFVSNMEKNHSITRQDYTSTRIKIQRLLWLLCSKVPITV